MPTLLSLVASQVVILTTYTATIAKGKQNNELGK